MPKVPARPRILVLHGPNLRLLGRREPEVYGATTLREINAALRQEGQALGLTVDTFQSDHEGELVGSIGAARGRCAGAILNAAAYTHTSIALRDAVLASGVPTIEVHLTNTLSREAFRHASYVGGVCVGRIEGFGPRSYLLALSALASLIEDRNLDGSHSAGTASARRVRRTA